MKNKQEISMTDLRNNLKEIINNEIAHLQEHLEALEPKDRLNFMIKLMPYVFPKIETVHYNESDTWHIL